MQFKAGLRSYNTLTNNNLYYAVANASGAYGKVFKSVLLSGLSATIATISPDDKPESLDAGIA